MCDEIHMEEKNRTVSFLNILKLFQNFSLSNETKLLLFLCSLKGFKIINSIAADCIVILMGYSSKVYEDIMRGFYNWNPNVMYNDNLNACVLFSRIGLKHRNLILIKKNITVGMKNDRSTLNRLHDKLALTLILTVPWDSLIIFFFL